jgi:hypothetical protein
VPEAFCRGRSHVSSKHGPPSDLHVINCIVTPLSQVNGLNSSGSRVRWLFRLMNPAAHLPSYPGFVGFKLFRFLCRLICNIEITGRKTIVHWELSHEIRYIHLLEQVHTDMECWLVCGWSKASNDRSHLLMTISC